MISLAQGDPMHDIGTADRHNRSPTMTRHRTHRGSQSSITVGAHRCAYIHITQKRLTAREEIAIHESQRHVVGLWTSSLPNNCMLFHRIRAINQRARGRAGGRRVRSVVNLSRDRGKEGYNGTGGAYASRATSGRRRQSHCPAAKTTSFDYRKYYIGQQAGASYFASVRWIHF